MFLFEDRVPNQCPVVGNYEETGWSNQCPMMNQWQRYQSCVTDPGFQHCYDDRYYVPQVVPQVMPQYYEVPGPPLHVGHNMPQHVDYSQPVSNLPCHGQQWDYSSMCYNVDGQPCQYTNVVDLEDFMNNEKRKEKSRVAARCRRTKEMQIFAELTAALPAKKEEVEQLDKASVMRLAISYLRARDVVSMLPNVDPEPPKLAHPKGLEEVSSEQSYMQALDGFLLVLSLQGDIVYCSENIADHIGVSQMEIMGQSVFEFSHPCDHDEIRQALHSSDAGRRDLLLRLKCTLTSKGRNVHLKSASYKVIHVVGHMLAPNEKAKSPEKNNNDNEKGDEDKNEKTGSLVAIGRPIPHPSNIEIPLGTKTFLSKHSLDMKFTYTDETLQSTLGFEPGDLEGHSLYDYHHAADSAALVHQFKSLFSKGQCETGQYRFLAKTGGYAWVQTQATVITDKQQKPISVVCVNYVISGIESKDEVFAAHQVQHADLKPVVSEPPLVPLPFPTALPVDVPNGAIVAVLPEQKGPTAVTDQIFAPRKKGMSQGFLMLSQDEGRPTMLKDEPEDLDLTHLAPTAGDACIPLENSPFELFDDFILSDNYCSLLGDDLASGSPVDSLTADSLLMSSPEPQENDSSCERSSLLTDLSLDAFENGKSDDNDIDEGHSPYIPTSDELPRLEPVAGLVMWGALPDCVSQARPQPTESSPAPALQRLLASAPTGPPPQDLITNIYSDQGLIPSRSISSWDAGVKRVMKQEEEPMAKRVKRSPSPAQAPAPGKQSSSVLMNLLDVPQQLQQVNYKAHPQYQVILNSQTLPHNPNIRNIPRNIMPNTMAQSDLKNQILKLTSNAMSPLSLNIGSPMYSLPSSPNTPNYSPAMSPAPKDRVLSPYSTPQSLSPVGYSQPPSRIVSPGPIQGGDPYLNIKMQPSPNFMQNDLLMDSNMPIASPDFWPDEMMQTSDLLSAFDDVKLG